MVSVNGHKESLSILLIDDNRAVADAMQIAFRIAGHRLTHATGPEDAFSLLSTERHDAILLDMNFTPGRSDGHEGLACLERLIAEDAAACVVVITAHSGIRIAVAAMQAGARDFLMKPWRNADLIAKVTAAAARGPDAAIAQMAAAGAESVRLIGESPVMHHLRDLIRRVAPTPAGVAVTGVSGSGRSLVARAIHAASADPVSPLRIDLRDEATWSALPGASGRTVILRHPDALTPVLQERLLDLLPPDARCIAIADALAPMIPALRRRVATVEIAVPPLGARTGDAVLLARHFARVAGNRFGRSGTRLSAAAEMLIATTDWPDDVRGLASRIERAVLLAEGETIDAAALLADDPASARPTTVPPAPATGFDLADTERSLIEAALREHRHNVSHAAAALGLSRGALYRRMARHGL